MSHDTPQSGRPLSEADVALLKRGDLLRRIDGRLSVHDLEHEDGLSGAYLDGTTHANSPPSHFTFIGRPGADGWIAWSGGDNPVPGVCVEVRWSDGETETARASETMPWHWKSSGRIIAFRLPTAEADRRAEGVSDKGYDLNYEGAMSDLNSVLDVLIRRINGEASLESAAEWVRLNYPDRAKALSTRPADADKGVDAGLIERLRGRLFNRPAEDYVNPDGPAAAAALEAAAVRERELRAANERMARLGRAIERERDEALAWAEKAENEAASRVHHDTFTAMQDRATRAEAQVSALREALATAAERFDEIYEAAQVSNVAYQNESIIHGINANADVAQSEARQALSAIPNKDASK